MITADHAIISEENQSRNKDRYLLVVQDRHTSWLQAYPLKRKTAECALEALKQFMPPGQIPNLIYTDGSEELKKAAKDWAASQDKSTPYRPQSNGRAERAVRMVKEGTSAVLLQSGFDESWWAEASQTYCFLHNVVDKTTNGYTPYELRFKESFPGQILAFGSDVLY